jgi:hypothetical protein
LSLPVKVGDEVLTSESPVLIKMDIEGFEMRALTGLRQTITRCKPVIFMEVSNLLEGAGSSIPELFEFMQGLGYVGRRLGLTKVDGAWTWEMTDVEPNEIEGKIKMFDAIWLHRNSGLGSII